LIQRHAPSRDAPIIDVGGGGSRLVDGLLARGFRNISVLDIANPALEVAKKRLGIRAEPVEWIVSDVLQYKPSGPWHIWHDRAVFHFLIAASDRASYLQTLKDALDPGGCVVIATFGPEGPDRCSGLDVTRYGPEMLADEFGRQFDLIESREEGHKTPKGAIQQFVYAVLRRNPAA